MPHFIALIREDADYTYMISFPDLPGCFAKADTKDDILPNAREALELCLSDTDLKDLIPTSKPTALTQRFNTELQEGAYLLPVPLPRKRERSEISYGLPIREMPLGASGSIRYVAVSDMRPEIAEQFTKYVCPCACPSVPGEEAFFVHDWERWAKSQVADEK